MLFFDIYAINLLCLHKIYLDNLCRDGEEILQNTQKGRALSRNTLQGFGNLRKDAVLPHYAGLIIELCCRPEDISQLRALIRGACEEYLKVCHILFLTENRSSHIVCYLNFEEYNLRVLADSLKQHLYNMLSDYRLNLFYTDVSDSPEEIYRQLDYLERHLCYSMICGYWRRLSYRFISQCESSGEALAHDAFSEIRDIFLRKDYEGLIRYIEDHRDRILESFSRSEQIQYSSRTIFLFIETLHSMIRHHFRENSWRTSLDDMTLTEILQRYPGIQKYCDFLTACIMEYCTAHEKDTAARYRQQFMLTVQTYIEQNLTTVTLNSIAEHFHMSVAYLSRSFKKYTGQNFSDYLSDRKLQKATLLLKQNLSIGSISKQLGYSSPAYFLARFKEKFGITPSVYRKRMLSREISAVPAKLSLEERPALYRTDGKTAGE